jgi:hypothetical protein
MNHNGESYGAVGDRRDRHECLTLDYESGLMSPIAGFGKMREDTMGT